MFKSLGILLGGIFVGAVGAEIIRKKYPNVMEDVYDETSEMISVVKEAFKKGYANAMQSKQAVKPGT